MNALGTATDHGVVPWLPVGLRAVAAAALLPAGLVKFLDYGARAATFAELGVPAPELLVLVVGAVELVAALALAFGVGSRLAGLAVVPVMLGAIATVGVVPSNAVVLVSCLGIVALGPGPYTLRDDQKGPLGRLV